MLVFLSHASAIYTLVFFLCVLHGLVLYIQNVSPLPRSPLNI